MNDIYGELDPGIADTVHLLRTNGFNTFTSCQGGDGHDFRQPTIRIQPADLADMRSEADKLANVLSAANYSGYYIKECRSFQNEAVPWMEHDWSFIEVEFWAEPLIVPDGVNVTSGTVRR